MPTEKMLAADRLRDQIDRMYRLTGPYQWVRELLVNCFQAKAKNVLIGTEWVAVAATGVHRRIIVDDGEGMNANNLKGFFNRYGGSGRPIGKLWANKGFGAKVSLLSWNHYGMVVISRNGDTVTFDDGSTGVATNMIWMTLGADVDDYGLRMFDLNAADPTAVRQDFQPVVPLHEFPVEFFSGDDDINWTKVANEALGTRKTGTAVILLGNHKDQDTILGNTDPGRYEAAKYGIRQFVSNKFYRLLPGMTVVANTPAAYPVFANTKKEPDRSLWPTTKAGLKADAGMRMVSLADAIKLGGGPTNRNKTRVLTSDSFIIPRSANNPVAVKVDWHITSDPMEFNESDSGQRGDLVGFPIVAVVHAMNDSEHMGVEEVFDLEARGVAGSSRTSAAVYKGTISRFIKVREVAKRVALVFTPIEDVDIQIYPDEPRTELYYSYQKGTVQKLPMDAWVDYWVHNVPKPIQDAINDHYKDLSSNINEDDINVKHLSNRYLKFFQNIAERLVKTGKSTQQGTANGGQGLAGKRKRTTKGNGNGGGGGTRTGPNTGTVVTGSSDAEGTTKVDAEKKDVPKDTYTADASGVPVRPRAVNSGLVQVVIVDENRSSVWPVMYDETQGIATVSRASRSYRRIEQVLVERYQAKGELDEDYMADSRWPLIRAGLDKAVRTHVSLAVTEVVQEAELDPADKFAILADCSVSNVLKGIKAIEEMAVSMSAYSLGNKRVVAKKKTAA